MRIGAPGVDPGGDRETFGTDSLPSGPVGATALMRLWRTLGATFQIHKGFMEEGKGCNRKLEWWERGKEKQDWCVCRKLWRAGERLRRLRGNPGTASISR